MLINQVLQLLVVVLVELEQMQVLFMDVLVQHVQFSVVVAEVEKDLHLEDVLVLVEQVVVVLGVDKLQEQPEQLILVAVEAVVAAIQVVVL